MASDPRSEIIPRNHPRLRSPDDPERTAAHWPDLEALLLDGSGTTWLSVATPQGPHVRPVFAAWTGSSFVLASRSIAAKSRHLDVDGHCSLAIDLSRAHLVVEGTAARLTGSADLTRASRAMLEVYGWPTAVVGEELDAPYAAPTSRGPPFRAYEVTPSRAFAFPTDHQFEGTRFTFP